MFWFDNFPAGVPVLLAYLLACRWLLVGPVVFCIFAFSSKNTCAASSQRAIAYCVDFAVFCAPTSKAKIVACFVLKRTWWHTFSVLSVKQTAAFAPGLFAWTCMVAGAQVCVACLSVYFCVIASSGSHSASLVSCRNGKLLLLLPLLLFARACFRWEAKHIDEGRRTFCFICAERVRGSCE